MTRTYRCSVIESCVYKRRWIFSAPDFDEDGVKFRTVEIEEQNGHTCSKGGLQQDEDDELSGDDLYSPESSSTQKITFEQTKFINTCIERNLGEPWQVLKAYQALLDSNSTPQFSCPTSGQITNFKSREKQAKGHGIVVTTENLRQWCNEHEFDEDDPDVDLPFVLFHRVVDDGAAGAPEYHVGITTKRLLSMVPRGEEVGIQIHSDTAHKLASAAIPQFFSGSLIGQDSFFQSSLR